MAPAGTISLLPDCVVGTPYFATIHERLLPLLPESMPIKAFPVPIPVPPLNENLQWHRLRHHDKSTTWMRNCLLGIARQMS